MVIPLNDGESAPAPAQDPELSKTPPKDAPWRYHSIAEYHALYSSGELTPLAVVEALLPLIRRDVSKASHHSIAFIASNPEEILEEARASTQRYKEGKSLGLFDGVPTAIKDESDVAGYRTTMGRKQNDQAFPIAKETVWSIQKWREAGGIVLGKLNMHEVGADTTNNNPNWGTPRNPHNDQYYIGGSSGGAAYAVSAGLIPVSLGADGGGSIRIPASFGGIYGLKPSHGRLDDTQSTVTVTGPLAANMSDLEAAYRLIATPNPSYPPSELFIPPGVASPSRPKVIGICDKWFDRADPAILKLCNDAVEYYKTKLGYEVVSIEIPYLPEGQTAHAMTILAEMAIRARAHASNKSAWLSGLTPANKILLSLGNVTPSRDYLLAQQLRNLQMQHLASLYQQHPGLIIVTPTTPMAGWPISGEGDLKHGVSDGNSSIRNMEYVWMANFTGNPAISCPVGYADPVKGQGRIPVSLMALGEWGSEDALIAWGKEAEVWLNEVYPGGRQRPANWEDVVANAKAEGKEVVVEEMESK
jgi:Asp-tRNA(Asn)/Glu-tRNA(Gln) amidotransferase A subunit family amidase